jgi:hypothetical protein
MLPSTVVQTTSAEAVGRTMQSAAACMNQMELKYECSKKLFCNFVTLSLFYYIHPL